jgi:tetratricopeptide (TPR) repeat protein
MRLASSRAQPKLLGPAPPALAAVTGAGPATAPALPTSPPPVAEPSAFRHAQGAAARGPADHRATSAFGGPSGDQAAPAPIPVLESETIKRGQSAFAEGNYAEAVRRAREAVSDGHAVAGHLLLGDSYYHLQRYADAVREYQSVLALEPANALARRGRELAERAASSP